MSVEQSIKNRRLQIYSVKGEAIVIAALSASILMAALFAPHNSYLSVLTWLASVSSVFILRYLHMRWFSANASYKKEYGFHEKCMHLGTLATGIAWASAILFFSESLPLLTSDILFVLLAVISAVSVVSLHGSLISFLLLNTPIVGFAFFMQPRLVENSSFNELHIAMFYSILFLFAIYLKKSILKSIRLELDNRDLVEAEKANELKLEELNQKLEERIAERTSELEIANQKLQESENRFKKAFRSIPDAVVIARLDNGEFIAVNDSVFSLTGYHPKDLIGETISNLGFWQDKERQKLFFSILQKQKVLRNFEAAIVIKSGDIRDCEMSAEIEEIDGELCVICALRDITESRKSEQALLESDLKFSTVFDGAPIGIVIGSADGKFLKTNRRFCEIVGYEESELVGMHIQDITVPDDLEANINKLENMVAGSIDGYQMEKRYYHKEGHQIWVQLNVSSVQNKSGNDLYIVGHVMDITERKLVEGELQKRQSMFERSEELGGIGHWEWDEVEAKLLYCSDHYANIFGMTMEEVVTVSSSHLGDVADIHPDDRERVYQAELDCSNNATRLDIEYRVIRKNGEIRYIHQLGDVEVNDEGEVIRTFGTLQDITENKEASLELNRRQAMFEHAEHIGRIGHWEWDEVDDRLLSCSPEYVNIYGQSKVDEFMGGMKSTEQDLQYVHPDDRERVYHEEKRCIDNALSMDLEYRIIDAKGEVRHLHQLGDVETNDQGEVIRSFGTVQDITQRKEAELELMKRQTMFEQAESLGRLGHWEWDEVEDRMAFCSQQYADIFGMTVEELLASIENHEDELRNIHPEDKQRVYETEIDYAQNPRDLDIEYRIVNKNGEIRHVQQLAKYEVDSNGQLVRSYGTLQDITERKEAELALKEQQLKAEDAERLGHFGHWEWDEEADCLSYCSAEYARIHEMSIEECLSTSDSFENDLQTLHPDDREGYDEYFDIIASKTSISEIEYRLITAKGNIVNIHEITRPVFNNEGEVCRYIGTIQDITERVRVENELHRTQEQFTGAFNNAPIGMALADQNGIILQMNHAGAAMVGYTMTELIGKSFAEFTHPDEMEFSVQQMRKMFGGELDAYNLTKQYRHRDGHYIWADVHTTLVRDQQGTPSYMVVQARDITEQRYLSEKLNYQASHDSLTDLINRREFEKRLDQLRESALSRDSVHTFCYMDLDQFKIINDTFGHAAGDELLRQLCSLIQGGVRGRDTLARLGGDEFGLLMENCPMSDALKAAETLKGRIDDFRFMWEGRVLSVGVSMGLVEIGRDCGTTVDLMKAADSACYMAKDDGRNRIRVYSETDGDTKSHRSEMLWATRIQEAILKDELFLVGQPIQGLYSNDKGMEFIELLLRIQDDKGNLVSAAAMLAAAERYHLTTKIDEWVVEKACSSILSNANQLERIALCSINLSGHSLSDMDFLHYIENIVDKYAISPGKICFEVTETAAISNFSRACKFMETLRARGFSFALDDFGTGLSSFNYLKQLPVDYVKIDGDFIKDIVNSPTSLAMVKSINELGHVFGKRTIAEYVESPEILTKVKSLGIDYAQGYCIGKPQSIVAKTVLKVVN